MKKIWKLLRLPPVIAYRLGLGPLIGRRILLLHTLGRVSSNWRITPLQYEEIDGNFYIGSARGPESDWYQNILRHNQVEVQVGDLNFSAVAVPSDDVEAVVSYMEILWERRPFFMKLLFRIQGFPAQPDRKDLYRYASKRTIVILHPQPPLHA